MEYRLIRSRRKTIGIEVTRDGEVIVRTPLRASRKIIEEAVAGRYDWIVRHQAEALEKKRERENSLAEMGRITISDMESMGERMKREFPPRVLQFAEEIGVTYGRITVRNQRTRWGSCSSKGNLNFNCLLMETPREIQDYVIVHELCHRREMNHSKRFWELVESVVPNYRECEAWLKKEGESILLRAFG